MADDKRNYEKLKADTEKVAEKVKNKELLTENECLSLINELKTLPDDEILPKIKGGNGLDIEKLYKEFNKIADDSKSKISDILSLISNGRVPSYQDRKEFDSLIDTLCEKYEVFCGTAEMELQDDEIPAEGSSISEYYEAIKNSKSAVLKGKINEIKKVLEKYLSVQSLVASYTLALEPFQKDAAILLNRIETGETDSLEEINEEIEGPKLFLSALECEDLNTDTGNDMLDTLEEKFSYSSRVTRGLSSRSYFISQKDDEALEEVGSDKKKIENNNEINKNSSISNVPEDETIIPESNNNESGENIIIYPEETAEDSKPNNIENNVVNVTIQNEDDDSVEVEETESEFVEDLKNNNIAVDNSKFGILSSDKSNSESKKLTASVFCNDLRKGNVKAAKFIIQQLEKISLVSSELLDEFAMPKDIALSTLEFLIRKGYLRKYSLLGEGEFYCATPRLDRALTFKEASKFAEVKQKRPEEIGELIEDKASSAYSRLVNLRLYIFNVKWLIQNEFKQYFSSNFTTNDSFGYRGYIKESEYYDLIIGEFWTDYNECNTFLNKAKEILLEDLMINRLIIASYDQNTVNEFTKVLLKHVPEYQKAKAIYLYASNENKFYEYNDMNEVTADYIWENTQFASEKSDDEEKENLDDKPEDAIIDKKLSDNSLTPEANEIEEGQLKESKKNDQVVNNPENKIYSLLNSNKFYCATAYLKAIANKDTKYEKLYNLLAYALNDPMKRCIYSADSVFDMVSDVHDDFSESLMLAVALRTFFSNQVCYDYNIKAYYDAIKAYPEISECQGLGNVLYKLVEFKDEQKKGMDAYADYHVKRTSELDDDLRKIQQEAKTFYENTILAKKSEKASQRRFLETKKLIFAPNGELGQRIKFVADNDKEMMPLVQEYVKENFIKEENVLSVDNIDYDLLWNYILEYWDKAGDKMMYKQRKDLMSHLRSNILSVTTKAIQIMIRWCLLVELKNGQQEDDSSIAYKKIRKRLIEDLNQAISEISKDISDDGIAIEKKAGDSVLKYTLEDIKQCLEGTYSENGKKYFYVDFLYTDDVILNDDYLPVLEAKLTDITRLQPENRILEHARKKLLNPKERLDEILNDSGDDYGTARLIIDYLRTTSRDFIVDGYARNVDDNEEYVKETAELKKTQFIGDLELAYVSGQIDNSDSGENKKEKILQIVDAWYEWACENSNYGFFERIMNGYLEEITKESETRKKDLLQQLEGFKNTSISGLSIEAKDKKIKKILAAIEEKNYTVAEDLLAHIYQADVDHDDIIEEHFLKDFLENYNEYYVPVAKYQASFSALVNGRTRNKDERGGKRLADNWLPGGSNLGKDRLTSLLTGFGFNIGQNSITEQAVIGRFENYTVKTIPAKDGKRENYTHPIAAFGSGASQEGFRVVCLNGKYDAAGLIDVMKLIGNARHTMIFLDCALDKPERRILARKSKLELGDKLFVVVDRTVMMYMVKNYDETRANRMLMSLIVPFGYYQPYVWESSNVMPPEIFMGRKHELESIESPTGANIVYGGRQLGKSALLKKAKADIDRDENGNRAVLVDIKYLGYKEAATKVGHALYDEGVLLEDIETSSWDELSRVIRKRLQSDKDYIPYLLLLLDESDAFIESCEEVNYRPFDALKEIQGIGIGRFKFVIAGLRNIVKFKRDVALGNNSVLTHLESMTVKPFQINEARELMEIPLHYLGLVFPKENESLLTLILASTNYFPGLIQMYCAKLLSAMRNKDYAGYDEADTPIYEISEEHIKKVLADPEFMDQIKEKFIITLKLDEDNYYYLIALIMAYLYHYNGYNDGYSANDIKECGKSLGISKISKLDNDKLNAFMEELKDLNVLRNTDNDHYLFTRVSFFQMMGTRVEVEDKLEEYLEA